VTENTKNGTSEFNHGLLSLHTLENLIFSLLLLSLSLLQ
jgi:hypothetical protein